MASKLVSILVLSLLFYPYLVAFAIILRRMCIDFGLCTFFSQAHQNLRVVLKRSKIWIYDSYERYREVIRNARPLNYYQIGQLVFLSVMCIVAFGILLSANAVVQQQAIFPRDSTVDGFYEPALTMGVNIISFLFLLSIFLVQNANQDYSSKLSRIVFSNRYLVSIFSFVAMGSVFNLLGVYFKPSSPFPFLSLVFSISSICLIFSLVLFTGHFMQVSNIVKYIESQILDKIRNGNIYRDDPYNLNTPIRNDGFIESLEKDTRIVSTTGITAIESSRPELVNTCTNTLTTTGITFLQTTREDDAANTFMSDLNDQFRFLVDTARTENHEQKYLEQLARSMGKISRESLRTKEISNVPFHWLNSTKDLFMRAISLEGNQAAGICIDEIGRIVLLTQQNQSGGASQSYTTYRGQLKEVGVICAQNSHLTSFLQAVFAKYEWQFVMMLNQLSDRSRYYQEFDVEYFFDEIAEIYLEAKNIQGSHLGLPQSFYGPDSFSTKVFYFGIFSVNKQTALAYSGMSSTPPEEVPIKNRGSVELSDPQSQHLFATYLKKYIGFHEKILQNGDKEDEAGYCVYPQNLYMLSSTFELEYTDSESLIAFLSESWHSIIKADVRSTKATGRQGGMPSQDIRNAVSDYYIILIFLCRGNKTILANELNRLASLHESLVSNYGRQEAQWLYKYMKFFGAILDGYYNIRQDFPEYYNNLATYFYQPGSSPSQSLVRPLVKIGYPGTDIQGDYGLSHSQIWKPSHDGIEQTTIPVFKNHAYSLHGKLILEKNLSVALNRGQRFLNRIL